MSFSMVRLRLVLHKRKWYGLSANSALQQYFLVMNKIFLTLVWIAVAILAVIAVATIALHRGEEINALWLLVAAICVYAIGYRFYAKFISVKVLVLDATRATPAERLENGRDFVATNKWVVFGHHFAAIAGPGPLVGPVLAAQFGYLPGTLWVLAGAVL
ncbi:MAG TPA: carbon starvation CstA family protein, partial [Terriglobales bacterium]